MENLTGFAEYPETQISRLDNGPRLGNFTSSEIFALMSNGKAKGSYGAPFYAYVNEKKMERRLGRVLGEDIFAKEVTWGKLVENHVFKLLDPEYTPCSVKTLDHPTIKSWKGTPDADKPAEKTIGEIKCPKTLKSFCQIIDAWKKGGITGVRDNHRDGEKFYWQMVSNAILTKSKFAELIVYVPYQKELEAIRQLAQNFDGDHPTRFIWIALAADDELPFLPENGYYKNLNILKFEVPVEDKMALHARVEEAEKLLFDVNLFTV